ncbi:unnamed protein product [Rotaria sordida]|uniref:PDZ domain-containing protein n=1 Tax=Rotaria sordida TaxID=392033 RepID=A0A815SQ14_9BILA|nr:unnamed protein product [Rotaria sordida]
MINIRQFSYREHWQEIEITLERPTDDDTSLGFAIAGGIDIPFLHHNFISVIVININENSLVYRDKRLELYDIILRVNHIDFTNIKHQEAVNILRKAGPEVKLLIRRLSPSINEEIKLEHNGKLGISIAGGIGKEYLENDHGIFVTNIGQYQTNKQLDIGDRLLRISSMYNTYDLRFVTHDMATKYIELACKESKMITLYVGHTRPIVGIKSERTLLHESQSDPCISKDESNINEVKNTSRVVVSDKDHHSETNDYDARYENCGNRLKNRLLNGRCTEGSKVLFGVRQEQPQVIKSTRAMPMKDLKSDHEANTRVEHFNSLYEQRPSELHHSRRITSVDQIFAQQMKLNEGVIFDADAEKLRRQQSKISQKARLEREGIVAGGDGRLRWQVD